MILLIFFLSSPLVIYSIFGIRISRIFLLLSFIFSNFSEKNRHEELTISKRFLNSILINFSAYTLYLSLITIFYIFFIDSSTIYIKDIISDIGPRLEIILIIYLGLKIDKEKVSKIFKAFFIGWILNFVQTINILLYTFDLSSNPMIGSFLVDQIKYPRLTLSDNSSFAYLYSGDDLLPSFFRSFGLIGEPSIFGIYAAMFFAILYYIPKKYLPNLFSHIPKYLLYFFGLLQCLLSISKSAIILVIFFIIFINYKKFFEFLSNLRISIKSLFFFLIVFLVAIFALNANNSFLNFLLERLTSDSGHIGHLSYTVTSSLSNNILKLFLGDGLGVHQSSHRFFISQFREGGLIGLIFSFNITFLFIKHIIEANKKVFFFNKIQKTNSFKNISACLAGMLLLSFLIYDPLNQPILWVTLIVSVLLFFEQEIILSDSGFTK